MTIILSNNDFKNTSRLQSIDLLRGVIVIIMALDHASYFVSKIHFGEFWGVSLSLNNNPIWFFARVISHICAPGFFFLMGISVLFLVESRLKSGWNYSRIRKFLITRGLVLILIELFLVTPAWIMGDLFSAIEIDTAIVPGVEGMIFGNFGILASLGVSIIIASLLIKVDKKWLLLLSGIGIVASYLYVNSLPVQFDQARYFSSILLIPGDWSPIKVTYPIFPWLFIALLGVVWGKYYKEKSNEIFDRTLQVGLTMVFLFIVLRFLHLGNFQMNYFDSIISFFTLIKYPASISFQLFAMGIVLILLGTFSKLKTFSTNNPIIVFGRTALLFYIIHLYIYLVIGLLFPNGTDFSMMVISWIGGLVILYFICKQYYYFKSKKGITSIWRFL